MKKAITDSLKQLVADRYLLVLSSALALLALAFITYVLLTVQPSELQLVSHYTAFGVTHLYRDQWFYLLTFALFGLFVALLHIAIALKVLVIKGPSLAASIMWLGIGIILIAWITASSILNVWSPL